jgi:hypothetical protein
MQILRHATMAIPIGFSLLCFLLLMSTSPKFQSAKVEGVALSGIETTDHQCPSQSDHHNQNDTHECCHQKLLFQSTAIQVQYPGFQRLPPVGAITAFVTRHLEVLIQPPISSENV